MGLSLLLGSLPVTAVLLPPNCAGDIHLREIPILPDAEQESFLPEPGVSPLFLPGKRSGPGTVPGPEVVISDVSEESPRTGIGNDTLSLKIHIAGGRVVQTDNGAY